MGQDGQRVQQVKGIKGVEEILSKKFDGHSIFSFF